MNEMYIWQQKEFPKFYWDEQKVTNRLVQVSHQHGKLLGIMSVVGFDLKNNAILDSMTEDIIMSSEIEGIMLNADDVRSSIAWQLGMDQAGVPTTDRYIEGVVEVMFDAVHNYDKPLTEERLFGWHSSLFPKPSRLQHLTIGSWRKSEMPMQVVSGRYGNEKVHYEAPESKDVPRMMGDFLDWMQAEKQTDPVLVAAIAHLWFVTIHPFSDGNGRIGRTIMDMLLAKADDAPYRFYSMSAAIGRNRKAYYKALESTQKGNLDITEWLIWFLGCMEEAIDKASEIVNRTLHKAAFWEKHRHTSMNDRQTTVVNMLWDGFEGKLTSTKWAKITKCSPDTALRDIQDLMQKGILNKADAGGRSTNYELNI